MRTIARSLAGTATGVLLFASPALAEPAAVCSHETWSIDGAPLAASFCVPATRAARVTVSETFTRGGQSFARSVEIDIVSGTETTRAVDNVPLADVGIAKQLHLTIAYRNGQAAVEHALLLPGAVVLK